MKAIGIKMVELQPMFSGEARIKGYKYEELNDKINKLNAFINGNLIFRKLDAEERNDMACQLTSMRNYSDTLLSRLTRAGVDFKELI